jgi:hypothetical protein
VHAHRQERSSRPQPAPAGWLEVHKKLTKLKAATMSGVPAPARNPMMQDYLPGWLGAVARPKIRASTYSMYETLIRLYLVPGLGTKRIESLQAADIRALLHRVQNTCQCCAQSKDARRKGGARSPSTRRSERSAPSLEY